jgi:hypothetical protein
LSFGFCLLEFVAVLPPFQNRPRPGGFISADDLAAVFEQAYRHANISATPPINVAGGPGGWSIWLDSELPDVSYVNVTDTFVNSGANIAAPQRVRAYTASPPAYTRVNNTLTFSAAGAQTIDGVALAEGDRVLVNIAGGNADNGIYEVSTLGTAGTPAVWDRAIDAMTSNMVRAGQIVEVGPEGTSNDNGLWQLITHDPITLNTSALQYTPIGGFDINSFKQLGVYHAGEGNAGAIGGFFVAPVVNKIIVNDLHRVTVPRIVSAIAVLLGTAGAAGAKCRLAIVQGNSRGDLTPTKIVYDSGDIAIDSGTNRLAAVTGLAIPLQAGVPYWCASWFNAAASSATVIAYDDPQEENFNPLGLSAAHLLVAGNTEINFNDYFRQNLTYGTAYPNPLTPTLISEWDEVDGSEGDIASPGVFLKFSQ